MENKQIIKKLKNILEKQEEQKKRGLNNYNVLTAVRKENAEVGMHSNFIFSLLDPNGEHYQGDLFLQLFIKEVLNIADFGKIDSVMAEEATIDNRRIDFTIKSEYYFIGIEMKIDASDLDNQIFDYFNDLDKKVEKENGRQEVKIYYLTKDGRSAPKKSYRDVEYQRISFKEHILNWLYACQNEVGNITNLNYAIGSYIDVVKKITGQYTSPITSFESLFLEDKELFEVLEDNKRKIFEQDEVFNDEVVELIEYGHKKAEEYLTDKCFETLFEKILEEHTGLVYKKYNKNLNGYDYIVRMLLKEKCEIKVFIKQHSIVSIGANPYYEGSLVKEEVNQIKEELDAQEYMIGKQKGKKLKEKSVVDICSDVLFGKKTITLDGDVINELNAHIQNISRSCASYNPTSYYQ